MTVYFSRVRLNPTRRGTRRLLASPQAMHATIMGSHPQGTVVDSTRVLWRADTPSSHEIEVFVVSPTRPDFTGLLEQAGWPTGVAWDSTEYDRLLARLKRGQEWRFRLTANPVVASGPEGFEPGARGKLRPHVTVGHQAGWFMSRASGWGFELPVGADGTPLVSVANRRMVSFSRSEGGGGSGRRGVVSITRCDFVGVLHVQDPDRLREALARGMGKAKAYGCGLMTLAQR